MGRVRAVDLASLRAAIAYVGQDAVIFDDSAYANIACGRPGATEAEVIAAARAAQADEFIRLPAGYATPSGPAGRGCRAGSGSAWRWPVPCCATRASCLWTRRPAPSTPRTKAAVQAALARLRAGRTTLVIAHRLATVQEADWIVVMERGAPSNRAPTPG